MLTQPAVFSEDRKYRYTLVRKFASGTGVVNFILLNPSTADETKNDPTVRRCMGYAASWGFETLIVTNIFALRSTDPNALYLEADPVGPDNDRWIMTCAKAAILVVAGWGAHGILNHRSFDLRHSLRSFKVRCLGKTKDGEPRHPLYLPANAQLIDL
jgi:hypothetical protein